MFDGVGEKYDITNTILSFGQDRAWRRRTRQRLNPQPGERILDLAAGTAVSTEELSRERGWLPVISPKACLPPVSTVTCQR